MAEEREMKRMAAGERRRWRREERPDPGTVPHRHGEPGGNQSLRILTPVFCHRRTRSSSEELGPHCLLFLSVSAFKMSELGVLWRDRVLEDLSPSMS